MCALLPTHMWVCFASPVFYHGRMWQSIKWLGHCCGGECAHNTHTDTQTHCKPRSRIAITLSVQNLPVTEEGSQPQIFNNVQCINIRIVTACWCACLPLLERYAGWAPLLKWAITIKTGELIVAIHGFGVCARAPLSTLAVLCSWWSYLTLMFLYSYLRRQR